MGQVCLPYRVWLPELNSSCSWLQVIKRVFFKTLEYSYFFPKQWSTSIFWMITMCPKNFEPQTLVSPFLVFFGNLPTTPRHLTSQSKPLVTSFLAQKSSMAPNCHQDEVGTSILPTVWLQPTLPVCFHSSPISNTNKWLLSTSFLPPPLCS